MSIKAVRDSIHIGQILHRKGQTLSGAASGYEVKKRCMANVSTSGYKPCSRVMYWNKKRRTFVCDKHGDMH